MKKGGVIVLLVVVAIICVAFGAAVGTHISSPRSVTTTKTTVEVSTIQISQQPATVYYDVPTVTMPADLMVADDVIQSFVVGNYAFNVTEYSPLPAITTNGVTKVFLAGVLLIFSVTSAYSSSSQYEITNFTWPGTFSESIPNPTNATLFGGEVRLNWLVSNKLLYLVVSTDS